ncbi:23S rRNA (adenine(2503)-C(2))-methyltransferase RlmN [Lachnoanaerobaculum gingivalis]
MTDIKSMDLDELKTFVKEMNEPEFRAKQLFEWMHKSLISSFDECTNLSKSFREKLKESTSLTNLKAVEVFKSKLDGTQKYLFALEDGNIIESVRMKYEHGNSVCISSQVGCRMGCKFCASTLDGLVRNLSVSEMLDQIYSIQKLLGERISNIVVMGSGEPMDNYDNIVKFVKIISSDMGLNISQRNITVSTCGIVPKIRALADEGLSITLALSLHAPNDEIRKTIMPVANKYALKDVISACDYYFKKTGRRVSYEYSLVAGVNDNIKEAMNLVKLVNGRNIHINLIPVNPIKERDFKQSDKLKIKAFRDFLEKHKVNATVRREMGRDIDGACGQLRRRFIQSETNS